jgi:hypothetical protein
MQAFVCIERGKNNTSGRTTNICVQSQTREEAVLLKWSSKSVIEKIALTCFKIVALINN